MNATLLVKELRGLRVYLAFAGVLALVTVLDFVFTTSGPRSLAETFGSVSSMPLPLVFGLVALALGTGVAVKEADEGTLVFLDALPLTRTQVFVAKLVAAMVVLAAFPGFQLLWLVVEHAFARGRLDGPFHWNLLVGAFLMQVLMLASFLAVGTLLGFARSLTWLLVGLLAAGLQRAIHFVPRLAVFDPLKLVESGVEGVVWRYPREAILAQLGVALVSTLAAWALFVRSGRGRTRLVNPRPVVSAVITLVTLAAVVGAALLWWRSGPDTEETPTGEAALETLPSSASGVTRTARYEFSYPSIEASAALALAERADGVAEQVSALLGVDAGAPIFVDLSGSMRNTVGTAYLERIRMRADEEAEATLAHETAHVLARRLVGEEGFTRWAQARVLDEGLASWVEGHFLEHPAEEQLVLAALLDRRALQLSALIDFDAFRRDGDDDLKYPIGRGLITAMVQRYGEGSIHRLLRAFGDERLPPKLSGAALWQATFQLAGMDLGLVADDFFGGVEATRAAQRAVLDALPRPQTRLVTQDGWYGVEVSAEPRDAYWRLAMRFRPGPDSPLDEYDRSWVRSGDVAWREARFIQRERVCFQAGLQFTRRTTLFEPWTCVPVSAAAPYEPPPPSPVEPESFVFDGGVEVVGGDDGGAGEPAPSP